MTISVDSVCTHADLVAEVGDDEALANLIPAGWGGSSAYARQSALDVVLDNLRNKSPRIEASDLSDVRELKRVVMYGAMASLYAKAMTTDDSPSAVQYRRYTDMFRSALLGLMPTVNNGNSRATVFAIGVARR